MSMAETLKRTSIDAAIVTLEDIFQQAEQADYVGEPVSQAEHALQAAALAARGGDTELTIAALLHDIGHLCYPGAKQMGNVGVLHHESLGADYLFSLGFSKRVSDLVAGHVNAKRYLATTRPEYLKQLSDASKETLAYQGGKMSAAEVSKFEQLSYAGDCLKLRAWDEAAKDSGKVPNKAIDETRTVPRLAAYLPLIREHLETQRLSESQIQGFKQQGFLHLTDVFAADQVERLRQYVTNLGDLPETAGKWMQYFEPGPDGSRLLCRIENFVQYHDALGSLIAGPRFTGWVSQLMNEPACLYKEKINFKFPGAAGFAAHQDAPAFTSFDHDFHITVMLSFDASTIDNGCLELVPGSWAKKYLPAKEDLTLADEAASELDWRPLETRAGDVVMFGSYLPHRSGRNTTHEPRRALYATYNGAAGGDVREAYFAEKRRVFPPEVERVAGRDYGSSGVFNVGNPVKS